MSKCRVAWDVRRTYYLLMKLYLRVYEYIKIRSRNYKSISYQLPMIQLLSIDRDIFVCFCNFNSK